MEDRRRDAIRQRVTELLAIERQIADGLQRRMGRVQASSEAAGAMQRFHAMATAHAEALSTHVERSSDQSAWTAAASPWPAVADEGAETRKPSSVLRHCHVAFVHAAAGYSSLFETALRLYVPPIRTLATQHLKAHVVAARAANELAVRAVAGELEEKGLYCSCVCPMCGMGACGCVAFGAGALSVAWQEAGASAGGPDGFPLQVPRPDSQLAAADVHEGDRIVAVDGQPVRSFQEIQTALRKHRLGDAVTLKTVRHGESREVVVKHVSDYPPA